MSFSEETRNSIMASGTSLRFVGSGNHHIGMRTWDPQFKANRELVKDLMTPNFLNTVSEVWEMRGTFPNAN